MTFKAVVLGVEYTDREEYERAARAKRGGRTGDWAVGLPVAFETESGVLHQGQVWSKAPAGYGSVILALDSGVYAKVNTSTLRGELIDGRGRSADPAIRGSVPKVRSL